MTQIILPNQNITGANLWSQVEDNDVAIRDVVNGDLGTDNIQTGLLPPTGSILQYAGGSAPTGWLLCQGQAVSRTGTYAALFAVVGTAYGTGDGSTTFNLPDLRGRVPVGKGSHSSVDALGDNDGTAVANRRPAHSHTAHSATTGISIQSGGSHTHNLNYYLGGSAIFGSGGGTSSTSVTAGTQVTQSGGSHSHSIIDSGHTHTVGSTGGTTDAPSFVVVNYIIKL